MVMHDGVRGLPLRGRSGRGGVRAGSRSSPPAARLFRLPPSQEPLSQNLHGRGGLQDSLHSMPILSWDVSQQGVRKVYSRLINA